VHADGTYRNGLKRKMKLVSEVISNINTAFEANKKP